MKYTLIKCLVVLSLSFVGVTAFGGAIEIVTIDEHGVGTFVDSTSTVHSFVGSFTEDPSGGATGHALVYDLTSVVLTFSMTGDYKIFKPGTEEVVGVVRFYGGNKIIFYDNDVGPGGESLADGSRLPTSYLSNVMEIDQTGSLGDITSTTVTPEAGMPGFADGINRQYNFLSTLPVPEPGIFSLLACGAALLGLRRGGVKKQ